MIDRPSMQYARLPALLAGCLSMLAAPGLAADGEGWELPPPAPILGDAGDGREASREIEFDTGRNQSSNRPEYESVIGTPSGNLTSVESNEPNSGGNTNHTNLDSTAPVPAAAPIQIRSDFWMVSSYRCRQSCTKACVCGQLDYLYSDGCQMYPSNQQAFHQSLAPGAPVCIVVHGSFVEADMLSQILTGGTIKDAETLVEENRPMFHWIRGAAPELPLNVVFYAWPSDAPITYLPQADVAILGRRSSFNALYLADLIDSISPDHPICLVGHSHGARMVAAALHLLAGGEVQGHRLCHPPTNCNRIRTVFLAGALDHHWLVPGQRYGRALYRTEGLVNVKNDHDIALNIYPLRRLFSHRAIGESGVTRRDRWALGELNCRLVEMDVTPIIGHGHLMKHYTHHPEIAYGLRHCIYFDDTEPVTTSARPDDSDIQQTSAGAAPTHDSASSLRTSSALRRGGDRGLQPMRDSSNERDQLSNRR